MLTDRRILRGLGVFHSSNNQDEAEAPQTHKNDPFALTGGSDTHVAAKPDIEIGFRPLPVGFRYQALYLDDIRLSMFMAPEWAEAKRYLFSIFAVPPRDLRRQPYDLPPFFPFFFFPTIRLDDYLFTPFREWTLLSEPFPFAALQNSGRIVFFTEASTHLHSL